MEQIEPAYATFEQAKKLKEIGFDSYTNIGYSESGKKYYHQGGQEPVKNGQNYYEGRDYQGEPFLCSAPEQWQIVEWLRINHKIWVSCELDEDMYKPRIYTFHNGNKHVPLGFKNYLTPQEACSAAFDYILNNLI
jgi:hypothetical protein